MKGNIMPLTQGKRIFRTVLASLWALVCIVVIWFFTQGVITSIDLDMVEYVWIWSLIIAVFAGLLALCVRFSLQLRRDWICWKQRPNR